MISDDTFYTFVKALFHQVRRLDNEMLALRVVLGTQIPNLRRQTDEWLRKIEQDPEEIEFRAWIDNLEHLGILEAFEKYDGPVQ